MSCSSSWTSSDLAALESAIKDGVKTVEYDDKKVTYRTLDEMLEIRNLMRQDLCTSDYENSSGRFTKVFAKSSKGLC